MLVNQAHFMKRQSTSLMYCYINKLSMPVSTVPLCLNHKTIQNFLHSLATCQINMSALMDQLHGNSDPLVFNITMHITKHGLHFSSSLFILLAIGHISIVVLQVFH